MIRPPQMATLPFASIADPLLADLAEGWCCAVVGLSNSGKSTLMRGLASPEASAHYRRLSGRPVSLVLVDGNRAVALSAQAFYEIVVRSVLEGLAVGEDDPLAVSLQVHHEGITDADSAFAASLSFNLALSELCEQSGSDIVILLDEFDEVYSALDDRALLNLRALVDRFRQRLRLVTATSRSLRLLRGRDLEDEFAELFAHSTFRMPPLSDAEAESLLAGLLADDPGSGFRNACIELAGGHPGLLQATAQGGRGLEAAELAEQAPRFPEVRVECLKLWGQLTEEEREALSAAATGAGDDAAPAAQARLGSLGLLREGRLFSPLMAHFAARRSRGPQAERQGVWVDVESGDVWVDGVRVPLLTDLEYRLLRALDERRGKLTDKYAIVTAVWGEAYLGEVDDARIEKLVSRLRAKIETDPAAPRYLLTQRGRGYKLVSTAGQAG